MSPTCCAQAPSVSKIHNATLSITSVLFFLGGMGFMVPLLIALDQSHLARAWSGTPWHGVSVVGVRLLSGEWARLLHKCREALFQQA